MGGGPASSDKVDKPLHLQLIAFGAFATLNVGLNLYNSIALNEKNFHDFPLNVNHEPAFAFPVFYTMFHMIVSCFAAFLLSSTIAKPATGPPTFQQLWDYKYQMLPIALCTSLNASLNNMSLTMVSLFVNQVIKATAPLPTMIFSYTVAKKTYSYTTMAAVFFVVLGSCMAVFYQFAKGGSSQVLGVVSCLISLLAASFKPVIMMIVMEGTAEKPKLAPTVLMTYDFGLAFFPMCLYWLCSSERSASIMYEQHHFVTATIIICAGSMAAFLFNLANYYFILLTSALTSTIGSNGVKIGLICFSAAVAGVKDVTSWVGISITVSAIIAYGYIGYIEKNPPKKEQPDAEKGLVAANESTPLKK